MYSIIKKERNKNPKVIREYLLSDWGPRKMSEVRDLNLQGEEGKSFR